jgi:hypothetical protein
MRWEGRRASLLVVGLQLAILSRAFLPLSPTPPPRSQLVSPLLEMADPGIHVAGALPVCRQHPVWHK